MMIKFLLFVLFISNNSFAQEIESCFESAKYYGDGSGRDKIEDYCFDQLKEHGAVSVQDSSASFEIVGSQNLIMMKDLVKNKVTAIAGSYSELDDVKDLAYDELKKELYVLSSHGVVRVYMSNLPGNVAPIRYFRHPENAQISKIAVDFFKGQIHLLSEQDQEIVVLDREANLMQAKNKQKQNILQRHPASNVKDMKFDRQTGKVVLKSR